MHLFEIGKIIYWKHGLSFGDNLFLTLLQKISNCEDVPWALVWYCCVIRVRSVCLPGKSVLPCLLVPEALNSNQCWDLKIKFSLCMDSVGVCVVLEWNEISVLVSWLFLNCNSVDQVLHAKNTDIWLTVEELWQMHSYYQQSKNSSTAMSKVTFSVSVLLWRIFSSAQEWVSLGHFYNSWQLKAELPAKTISVIQCSAEAPGIITGWLDFTELL